jgi:hypothetical protein
MWLQTPGFTGIVGGNPGYSTYLAWDHESKFGVVVLANASTDIDHVVHLLISKLPFRLSQDAPRDLASYAADTRIQMAIS